MPDDLELENADVLEMPDVLRLDLCANAKDLSTSEKTLIVDNLAKSFGLPILLRRLGLK